jgi:hypothetical protein
VISPVQGVCKLCHSAGELRRSHFIPAGAYRLIQESLGEPPVVIKQALTIQKNEQATAHILCPKCEDRFNENGERWVLDHCYRVGEGFKLKSLIDGTEPVMGNGLKVYSAVGIPEIEVGKLAYFVASILWRGSVHEWRSGKETIRTPSLGSKYEEDVRRYLLGEASFPDDAAVWVSIIPNENLWSAVCIPYGEKMQQFWRYKFIFLGIVFMFFLGKLSSYTVRRACSFRSPEQFIFVGDETSDMVIRDFGRLIVKSKRIVSPT